MCLGAAQERHISSPTVFIAPVEKTRLENVIKKVIECRITLDMCLALFAGSTLTIRNSKIALRSGRKAAMIFIWHDSCSLLCSSI